MNWKEILITSLEVAVLATLAEFAVTQTFNEVTLYAAGLTFLAKLSLELKKRLQRNTSAKKKKSGYKTLFFGN